MGVESAVCSMVEGADEVRGRWGVGVSSGVLVWLQNGGGGGAGGERGWQGLSEKRGGVGSWLDILNAKAGWMVERETHDKLLS
jgi:hypothetical protein